MATSLDRRLSALEGAQRVGVILVSWLPTDGMRETVKHDGRTYVQASDETREHFRARLSALLGNCGQRFIFIDEAQSGEVHHGH